MISQKAPKKLLFLSTPVGALGSGIGGGVELTLQNAAKALMAKGHSVEIVAPEGSVTVLPSLQRSLVRCKHPPKLKLAQML